MTQHLDDMRHYIRLTESEFHKQDLDDPIIDDPMNDLDLVVEDPLLDDIRDVIFKLKSYQETEGTPDYAQGVEEGLALSASMLERLIERYSYKK